MIDMMSTTLADQLKIPLRAKSTPMNLQMAVSGSRSKINVECETRFQYQNIDETRRWDVANIDHYDIVLGTPFLWQHSVLLGFNPTRIVIGSNASKPMSGSDMIIYRGARATVTQQSIENLRKTVFSDAQDLFKEAATTPLPPMRAINHEIPLKDVLPATVKKFRSEPSALSAFLPAIHPITARSLCRRHAEGPSYQTI